MGIDLKSDQDGGSAKLLGAMALAAEACAGRWRDDGSAALSHPLAVCNELLQVGIIGPDLLAAALLHDILEDDADHAAQWLTRIRGAVGDAVTDIVLALTDDPRQDGITRKASQIARMATATPAVCQVKLADRLANLRSPSPRWDDTRRRFYAAHSRALLAVMGRRAHPLLEKRIAACLGAGNWE